MLARKTTQARDQVARLVLGVHPRHQVVREVTLRLKRGEPAQSGRVRRKQ
jgi:hypothetical protein